MSQALSFRRSFSIQSSKLVESLVGIDLDDVDDVAIRLADVMLVVGGVLHFAADDQVHQRLVLDVGDRDVGADALLPGFELRRERIDHAELLVVAGALAGDGEDLAIHQRRGGLGHLPLGVGGVAVLRGDGPQAVFLGDFELAERGRVFVELDDLEPLGLAGIGEALGEVLADAATRRSTSTDAGRLAQPATSATSATATKVIVLAVSLMIEAPKIHHEDTDDRIDKMTNEIGFSCIPFSFALSLHSSCILVAKLVIVRVTYAAVFFLP